MPKRLLITPTIHSEKTRTVNLGKKATQLYTNKEIGKAVKLTGPGTYELCAAGDKIEGIITSSEYSTTGASRGEMSVGGIVCSGYFEVVSTVKLAAGDFVVAGAQPAFGTPLPGIGSGGVPALPVDKAGASPTAPFLARVVDLGDRGTGDAGTICVAEFIN